MGSSASTRAKAKAAAAVEVVTDPSPAADSELPESVVTNAGGDIGDKTPSSTADASANTGALSETPGSKKELGKLEECVEDMDDATSSEDSSGTEKSGEDAGDMEKGDGHLEKTASKDESATKTSIACHLRDVACQSYCNGDDPDDPMTTDLDAPPPSPQQVQLPSRNPEQTANPVLTEDVLRAVGGDQKAVGAAAAEVHQHPYEALSQSKGKVFFPNVQQQNVCEGGICQVGDHHETATVFVAQRQQPELAPLTNTTKFELQRQHFLSASSLLAGTDPQQLPHPFEGAIQAGMEGPPPIGDHKAAVIPEQQQQHRPAVAEGSFHCCSVRLA